MALIREQLFATCFIRAEFADLQEFLAGYKLNSSFSDSLFSEKDLFLRVLKPVELAVSISQEIRQQKSEEQTEEESL